MRQRELGAAAPQRSRSGRDFQRAAQLAAGANLELAHALAREAQLAVSGARTDRPVAAGDTIVLTDAQDGAFEDGKTWLRNLVDAASSAAARRAQDLAWRPGARGHVRAEPAEARWAAWRRDDASDSGRDAAAGRDRLTHRALPGAAKARSPVRGAQVLVRGAQGDHAPKARPLAPAGRLAHTAWTPASEVYVGGSCPCPRRYRAS